MSAQNHPCWHRKFRGLRQTLRAESVAKSRLCSQLVQENLKEEAGIVLQLAVHQLSLEYWRFVV